MDARRYNTRFKKVLFPVMWVKKKSKLLAKELFMQTSTLIYIINEYNKYDSKNNFQIAKLTVIISDLTNFHFFILTNCLQILANLFFVLVGFLIQQLFSDTEIL